MNVAIAHTAAPPIGGKKHGPTARLLVILLHDSSAADDRHAAFSLIFGPGRESGSLRARLHPASAMPVPCLPSCARVSQAVPSCTPPNAASLLTAGEPAQSAARAARLPSWKRR